MPNGAEDYNTYWRDIGVFVKYGMMQDAKFFERVRPALIFPTTTDDFLTLEELGINPETDKPDPSERTEPFIAFYTPDSTSFAPYIEMASRRGDHVLIMDHEIDNQFMSFLEYTLQGKIRFKRVDAELGGEAADGSLDQDVLSELFSEVLADIAPHVKISLQALGEDALPALIHESEENRRMREMREQFERIRRFEENKDEDAPGPSIDEMFPQDETLILNHDQSLIRRLSTLAAVPATRSRAENMARYLYDMARLANGTLQGDDLVRFLNESSEYLTELADAGEQ